MFVGCIVLGGRVGDADAAAEVLEELGQPLMTVGQPREVFQDQGIDLALPELWIEQEELIDPFQDVHFDASQQLELRHVGHERRLLVLLILLPLLLLLLFVLTARELVLESLEQPGERGFRLRL